MSMNYVNLFELMEFLFQKILVSMYIEMSKMFSSIKAPDMAYLSDNAQQISLCPVEISSQPCLEYNTDKEF